MPQTVNTTTAAPVASITSVTAVRTEDCVTTITTVAAIAGAVIRHLAVDHRQYRSSVIINPGTMSSPPTVLAVLSSVAAHCAVGTVISIPTAACLVGGNHAITQRERAQIPDAATIVSRGSRIAITAIPALAILDGQARNTGGATSDIEHAAGVVAADGQVGWSGPDDRQVLGEAYLRTCECDGPGDGKFDGVTVIGIRYDLTQGTGAAVVAATRDDIRRGLQVCGGGDSAKDNHQDSSEDWERLHDWVLGCEQSTSRQGMVAGGGLG